MRVSVRVCERVCVVVCVGACVDVRVRVSEQESVLKRDLMCLDDSKSLYREIERKKLVFLFDEWVGGTLISESV